EPGGRSNYRVGKSSCSPAPLPSRYLLSSSPLFIPFGSSPAAPERNGPPDTIASRRTFGCHASERGSSMLRGEIMTKRMLINALYPEECRIAVAEDDQLLELEVERADHATLKGNIYKAQITRIEPSLQAAFLDIGSNRYGFLQINDIHPAYF